MSEHDIPRAETEIVWLFTFGFGQTDPRTGQSLANRYVRVSGRTVEHCRERMLGRFGGRDVAGNWAFDYPDAESAGVDRYGLTEIDFISGLPVPRCLTCDDRGLVSATGRGSDGPEPCPDCTEVDL